MSANPLPAIEGGYGKLLGNNGRTTLAGLMKIKLRGAGLRIVYKLVKTESEMLIVVKIIGLAMLGVVIFEWYEIR